MRQEPALPFLLLLACVACSDTPSAPTRGTSPAPSPASPTSSAGPFAISGKTLDLTTGAAAPGFSIAVAGQSVTTDASGVYFMTLAKGDYQVNGADGTPLGAIAVRGPWTRGDVFVNVGQCDVRYGAVTDSASGQPIIGAVVGGKPTDADGWYRLDLDANGCNALKFFGTTILTATAYGYADVKTGIGRGFLGARRLDIQMDRQ